jgi:hypothetical protein
LPALLRLLKPKILVIILSNFSAVALFVKAVKHFFGIHGNKLVCDNHSDWSNYLIVTNRIDVTWKLSPHAAGYVNNAQ